MPIPASEARGLYTRMSVDMLREVMEIFPFLSSFFKVKETTTKYVVINVMRGTEKIAIDVPRGSDGNYNKISNSTETIFEPPYYREWMNATEIDLYDRIAGDCEVGMDEFLQFMDSMAEKLTLLVNKIKRRYELQAAQIFETGVVTVADGNNIDFGRLPASKIANNSGNTWLTDAVDPNANLEEMANYLRTDGKSQGGVVNILFGTTAWSHYLGNKKVRERADIRNFKLDDIYAPQKNALGGVLHGETTIGSYMAKLWTYPEYYEDAAGNMVPYLNPKIAVVLPENPQFVHAFAAVPQILTGGRKTIKKGAYIFGEKIEEYDGIHKMDVKSAGLLIPTAVNQISTIQPVA